MTGRVVEAREVVATDPDAFKIGGGKHSVTLKDGTKLSGDFVPYEWGAAGDFIVKSGKDDEGTLVRLKDIAKA